MEYTEYCDIDEVEFSPKFEFIPKIYQSTSPSLYNTIHGWEAIKYGSAFSLSYYQSSCLFIIEIKRLEILGKLVSNGLSNLWEHRKYFSYDDVEDKIDTILTDDYKCYQGCYAIDEDCKKWMELKMNRRLNKSNYQTPESRNKLRHNYDYLKSVRHNIYRQIHSYLEIIKKNKGYLEEMNDLQDYDDVLKVLIKKNQKKYKGNWETP